jgi:hypothetical protein
MASGKNHDRAILFTSPIVGIINANISNFFKKLEM